jgi:hypothetical protein
VNIVTGSPELAGVPGAVKAVVTIEDCPAGMAFQTQFYDAAGEMIRMDQHIDAYRAFDALSGKASLYRPPVLMMPGAA